MRSLAAAALLSLGCAPALDGEVRDLRVKLATAERARADLQARVDDLDNRVFLLTDQVESQKVALSRRGNPLDPAASLPVVTLTPDAPQAEPEPEPEPPPPPPKAQARRALHLEGHPRPTESAAVGDGLGVVKLPDRGIPVERPSPSGEPLQLYRDAYAKLMAGQHDAAAGEFREFVRRWPRHDYADNAQYWLGESFYARKEFAQAAPEFQAVVARWPSGNKAPDALLKLAYCMIAVGSLDDGRRTLKQVAEHYPRTDAALLASRRLAELEGGK